MYFSSAKLEQLIDGLQQRSGRSWTIREISGATGISPAYLTHLRKGSRKFPSLEVIDRLCRFFQIRLFDLIEEGDGDPWLSTQDTPESDPPMATWQGRIRQALDLCNRMIAARDPQHALELLSLLGGSHQFFSGERDLEAEMKLTQAAALIELGEFDGAAEVLDALLSGTVSDKVRTRALCLQSEVCLRRGRTAEARSALQAAKTVAMAAEDHELTVHVMSSLGQYYAKLGEHGAAVYYYEKARQQSAGPGGCPEQARVLLRLGIEQMKILNFDAAERTLCTAKAHSAPDDGVRADADHYLGRLACLRGDMEQAILHLNRALIAHRESGRCRDAGSDLLMLAMCKRRMNNWHDVSEHALESAISFENVNERRSAVRARLLWIESQMQGDHLQEQLSQWLAEIGEELTGVDSPLDSARWLHLQAEMCRRTGHVELGLTLSLQALSLYEDLAGRTA
ncbi:tetratricopeptide repeat protein [Tumebacillus sp. DT12]|uniref:Tetratricopeptide repeat protein n=1 Tax=Tumebacillus lacus TaxID=2995335 RepID=A0ABT3WX18_9BACL|nr:tetratricopeptide repeat protein [Tumebacillus lacus]MCX7569222.1 tetratricopeptide repeat protein [Tumebacillus lacus]